MKVAVLCSSVNPLEDNELISEFSKRRRIRILDIVNLFTPEDILDLEEKITDDADLSVIKVFSEDSLLSDVFEWERDSVIVVYGLPCNALESLSSYPCIFLTMWLLDASIETDMDLLMFVLSDPRESLIKVLSRLDVDIYVKRDTPGGVTFDRLNVIRSSSNEISHNEPSSEEHQ